jgi:hypothetical protein
MPVSTLSQQATWDASACASSQSICCAELTHTVSPCCAASGHSSASSTPSSNTTGSVMPALRNASASSRQATAKPSQWPERAPATRVRP